MERYFYARLTETERRLEKMEDRTRTISTRFPYITSAGCCGAGGFQPADIANILGQFRRKLVPPQADANTVVCIDGIPIIESQNFQCMVSAAGSSKQSKDGTSTPQGCISRMIIRKVRIFGLSTQTTRRCLSQSQPFSI
ncbi:unnamed protein product [Onchocerca ochengi]|uniref:DUF2263 domain-containing protein n=1 Tax=Onchocerca ochengi TaxID=42157 RepID=A0A182ENX0_ONCOC|nr:unnamed protein product [Onchocerca ochengi]